MSSRTRSRRSDRSSPARFRRWTLIVILFYLDYATRHFFGRGDLAGVKTIHFARWVFIDGKRRMFFASNYDGSLESYMDDFIDKVAWGLNLVFSNGVGYPRTSWLVRGGARDELAFKDYLRVHQVPTRVWYSAYDRLTALNIQQNERIRAGLRGERRRASVGRGRCERSISPTSRACSPAATATCERPRSCCSGSRMPAAARRWLGDTAGAITSSEARPDDRALNLAFTSSGLAQLGLPEAALAMFSNEFVAGMTTRAPLAHSGRPRRERAGAMGVGRPERPAGRHRAALSTPGTTPACSGSRRSTRERSRRRARAAPPPGDVATSTTSSRSASATGSRSRSSRGSRKTGPPETTVRAGEFLLGYPNEYDLLHGPAAARPAADPRGTLPRDAAGLRPRRPRAQRQLPRPPPAAAGRARLLALRRRRDAARRRHAATRRRGVRLAAKMVGRWPSGAPLALAPDADDPRLAERERLRLPRARPARSPLPGRLAHPPLPPARLPRSAAGKRATRGRSTAATASCAEAANTGRR